MYYTSYNMCIPACIISIVYIQYTCTFGNTNIPVELSQPPPNIISHRRFRLRTWVGIFTAEVTLSTQQPALQETLAVSKYLCKALFPQTATLWGFANLGGTQIQI